MENFQLYRTNILLSGQVKWDLILNSDKMDGELYVNDFHLSPVSHSAPFNNLPEESLLNYTHQENLRKYYKNTESIFFDSCIEPRLKHEWLIVDDNKYTVYEDSFEAGPKNSIYSAYHKSIEIFCPIWLEHVSDDLKFVVDVYADTGKRIISKPINVNKGKFGKYLNNYISYLGLDRGIDDVLNIDLKNKKITLTGLSLDSGNIVKLDISNIVNNLLYRERPLLEFDSTLINNFSNNRIITRQLFNLCFHLDLNDLLPSHISDMVYGSKLNFKIRTYIGDKELELKDFYSNYEFIPKDIIYHPKLSDILQDSYTIPTYNQNVLDYLNDYKYVNYINKNKYIQNTIHWSLNDNVDYIFNIYNGFGPYEPHEDGIYYYSHRYGKTPDLIYKDYNKSLNNTGWCNLVILDSIDSWGKFLHDNDHYGKLKQLSTDFKHKWVNNVLYDNKSSMQWPEFKMIILTTESDSIYKDIKDSIKSGAFNDYMFLTDDENICYVRFKATDEFVGIIVNGDKLNYVTFKGFSNVINNYPIDPNHPLAYIKEKINSVKQIPLVVMDKSLYITNAPSPSTSTEEIEYYKNDNIPINECYVLRYDGKIKPTFLSKDESEHKNLKYFKTSKTETEYLNSEFIKYSNSSYPPQFPSIGYCAWEKEAQNFSKYDSIIPIIKPEMSVILYSKKDTKGELVKLNVLIKEYISQLYPNLDTETIYKMYNIESLFEYKTLYNIEEYEYKINMVLK